MRRYKRISLSEREKIYELGQQNYNQSYIAKKLDRNRSTISRELKRCLADPLGYLPDRADAIARRFARRNSKLFRSANLLSCVLHLLKEGWSPEQISGRLKLESNHISISHETIYKYIYSQQGLEQKLYKLLARHKPKRTRWYSRKPKRSHIPDGSNISFRPKNVEHRKKIGHWEGDLVVFGSLKSSNVTTLLERKSRLAKLIHNNSKYTEEVIGGIKNKLSQLEPQQVKTITFDRGTEFAAFRNLEIDSYFCNPHSPWQKGSNENFNGRLRRYLPKKFDHRNLSQNLLDKIEQKMNNQPRKCLRFKTPLEVFYNQNLQYVALDP
jgi:IS30 family transposase